MELKKVLELPLKVKLSLGKKELNNLSRFFRRENNLRRFSRSVFLLDFSLEYPQRKKFKQVVSFRLTVSYLSQKK
jgi:hypothetical protein